jgi:hypothetical protein
MMFISLAFTACRNPSSASGDDEEDFTPISPDSVSSETFNDGLLDFPVLTDFTYTTTPKDYQNLMILYDDKTDGDRELLEQVKSCYNEAGVHYTLISFDEFKASGAPFGDLGANDLFICATGLLWESGIDQSRIIDFVDKGGHAFFLINTGPDPTLGEALGIDLTDVDSIYDISAVNPRGMKLDGSIFPGMESVGAFLTSSSYRYDLTGDCRVLASSGSIPLIWTRDYGSGSFTYTNSTCFQSVFFRGLLLQLTGISAPYFLSTCYNTALLFIDDFPLPLSGLYNDTVGMRDSDFILNQWWPDMKELRSRFSLMYSCFAIGSYKNRSTSPLPALEEELAEQFVHMGDEIRKVGAELGLHGYNHIPLALAGEADFSAFPDDGQGWENQALMEEGLAYFRAFLDKTFGSFPVYSYVPPMNRMSHTGKRALNAVFPDITNIDGLFQGSEDAGDLIQEPGPDELLKGCFDIPRFSSGYNQSEDELWIIYDTLAWCGLFSHFVHPDDAMDLLRSEGRSWSQMYHSFLGLMEGLFYKLPGLRRMSSGQFCRVLEGMEDLKVYSHRSGNTITIRYSGGKGPVYHYLRLPPGQKVSSISGGSCRAILPGDGLYLLEGRSQQLKVRISR